MDDLTQEFIAETRDMLEHVGNALLDWERNPSNIENLDEIFRFVHTVKGSCGFLNLPRIGKLAHDAEAVLDELRSGKRKSDETVVRGLLRTIDRIMVLTASLESGELSSGAAENDVFQPSRQSVATSNETVQPAATVSKRNVRISIDLLETMMTQVSDLVLVRNQLARTLLPTLGVDATAAQLDPLSARVGELRDSIARARMQPVDRLFAALPRLVRDTASQLGKSVRLVIEGTDVEIDREMVEQLRDPLIHVVRNAIDHGIESSDRRAAQGKESEAELRVTARQSGNQVVISISDDGNGIDLDRLRSKAVFAGKPEAMGLSPEAVADLVFEPGISTAKGITGVSGRGVGMDVVRVNVEKLGGNVSLVNRPGAGLTVDIRVPLTLSVVTVLTVAAGGVIFAVPRAAVQEIISIRSKNIAIENLGAGRLATVRGEKLGAFSLSEVLGLQDVDEMHLIIIQPTGGRRFAMLVDSVIDEEEVVVRQVAPQLAATGVFVGQALPNSGQPILLIDLRGAARRAGMITHRLNSSAVAAKPAAAATISLLSFIGLDGSLWGVRTALVQRVEDVARDAFTLRKDDAFVMLNDALLPVLLDGELPSTEQISLLRLSDGKGCLGYPVLQVKDLIRIAEGTMLSPAKHPIATVGNQVIQILDEAILFSDGRSRPRAFHHAG